MAKFNIEDYFIEAEKTVPLNAQNRRYTKYFCDYLMPDNEEFDINIFSSLRTDTVLDSLISFMDETNSYAKKTANQYKGSLKLLFEYLERFFQIESSIYINGNFVPEFEIEFQKIIEHYKDAIDKSIADDDTYEALIAKVCDLENQYSYQDAAKGIDRFSHNKSTKELSLYTDVLSACATRLIIEYALGNDVICDLKINDIDLDNCCIKRGRYTLPLSAELWTNLNEYIIIRQYLLDKIGKKQNILFIKSNGEPVSSTQDYANTLFKKTIKEVTKTASVASEPFARRRLIRMIKEGFNAETITEITGYKDKTLKSVCEFINDNDISETQNKLQSFLTSQYTNNIKRKKGSFKCPFCGKNKSANANEWVVVQIGNNEAKYLACKDCEGDDGKIKY